MRIDSTGNVGIGTSSPACGLHVDNPDNSAITAILDTDNSAVKMVFRNNTETGNNVQIGADGSSLVALTGASERLRVLSGGGLTFNGDTATANALDDYEEGTWTPVYQALTSNPTVTHSVQVGRYVKIGQFVNVMFRIQTSAASGGSGALVIGGLPFASTNVSNLFASGPIGFSFGFTNFNPQTLLVGANGTQIQLIRNSGTDAHSALGTAITTGELTNSSSSNDVIGALSYRTD